MKKPLSPDNSLAFDLACAATIAPISGAIVGAIRAWVSPFAVLKEINYIRNKGINSLSEYSAHIAGAVAYSAEAYHIVSSLVEDPTNPRNYIPIATNAAGTTFQLALWAYKRGRKTGLETRLKSLGAAQ